MALCNRNSGKRWTSEEEKQLCKLAKGNTPTGVISIKLGRTEDAIQAKASELDVRADVDIYVFIPSSGKRKNKRKLD